LQDPIAVRVFGEDDDDRARGGERPATSGGEGADGLEVPSAIERVPERCLGIAGVEGEVETDHVELAFRDCGEQVRFEDLYSDGIAAGVAGGQPHGAGVDVASGDDRAPAGGVDAHRSG